jgi:signal transduction histidine kinase
MPLRSLRARLVLLLLASSTLAALLFAYVAVRQFDTYEREQALKGLANDAKAAEQVIQAAQHTSLDQADISSKSAREIVAQWTRPPYKLYFAKSRSVPNDLPVRLDAFPAALDDRIDWPKLTRPKKPQPQSFELRVDGKRYAGVAVALRLSSKDLPASVRGVTVGAVVLARESSSLKVSALAQAKRLAPSFALAVLFALIAALIISRRITRPVKELSAASERIASGMYDIELRTHGRDELGTLAARFQLMARKLKEADELERNFLMRVSHELRTPLTAIQGHVQALADDIIDDPDERAASLDVVLSESERLQRLIGDLLDLAKLEARRFSLTRDEVDLEALCSLAYQARVQSARSREIRLGFTSSGRAIVTGDGDRILQIVGNLLENALRWTPDGGDIEMSLSREGRTATIAVGDTGPGVPLDRREAIFRPFVSEHEAGTGLGLSVASELAAAMGGSLSVTDRPGGGALFRLRLPLSQQPARVGERPSATPA